MRFKVGQKVVCIETFTGSMNFYKPERMPSEGETFEVCSVLDGGIALVEINEFIHGNRWHFNDMKFAPLEDIKQAETAVNELLEELVITQEQLN